MGLNLQGMTTETRNPRTMGLDGMSELEIVTVMNEEDARVPLAIAKTLPQIAQAAHWAVEAFEQGGRLFYMGAGTSGRLGVLDAAECPPTFGVPQGMVVGLIAGGEKAFTVAVEGAEDSREMAVEDLKAYQLTQKDFVVGIAASGRTPYVLGGLDYAKSLGCHTAAIACNPGQRSGQGQQSWPSRWNVARGADRSTPAEIRHGTEADPEHDLDCIHGALRQSLPEPDGGCDADQRKTAHPCGKYRDGCHRCGAGRGSQGHR